MSETKTTPKKMRNKVTNDNGIVFMGDRPDDLTEFDDKTSISVRKIDGLLVDELAGRQIAAMLRVSSDPVALIAALKRGELPDQRRRARQPTEVERAVLAARAARAKKEGAEFDEDATLAGFRALSKAQKAAVIATVEVAKELQKIRGKDAADPLAF